MHWKTGQLKAGFDEQYLDEISFALILTFSHLDLPRVAAHLVHRYSHWQKSSNHVKIGFSMTRRRERQERATAGQRDRQ